VKNPALSVSLRQGGDRRGAGTEGDPYQRAHSVHHFGLLGDRFMRPSCGKGQREEAPALISGEGRGGEGRVITVA
jgi:hypothetical protein